MTRGCFRLDRALKKMASTSTSKGTRKTYSFEEREILVNLIYKYLNDNEEEKPAEGNVVGGKRKSVWSELTEEYNSLVGPENARSSLQLRRCWENMKANKKNRDDKKVMDKTGTDSPQDQPPNLVTLPPNVIFQPKESESFAFEGIMPQTDQNLNGKSDEDLNVDVEEESPSNGAKVVDNAPPAEINVPVALKLKRKVKSSKTPVKQKVPKTSQIFSNQLNEFAILEAQLRLDTAALLKEEAKLKLKEAQFKQEEARLRMVCASYKLQKWKEDCADCVDCVIAEDEQET